MSAPPPPDRESLSLLGDDVVAQAREAPGGGGGILRSLSIRTPQLSPAGVPSALAAQRPRGRVMSFATMAVAPSPHLGPLVPPATPALLAAGALGTVDDLPLGALRRKATAQNLGVTAAAALALRSPAGGVGGAPPAPGSSLLTTTTASSTARGSSAAPGTFALPPPAAGLSRAMSTLELSRAAAASASTPKSFPDSVADPLDGLGGMPLQVDAGVQTDESAILPRGGGLWDASAAPATRSPWHALPPLVTSAAATAGGAPSPEGGSSSESAASAAATPPPNAVSAVPASRAMTRRQKLLMGAMIAAIAVGFGLALFVNGIASRLIPPRSAAYSGPDTPLALRLVAGVPDPLYVLCSGRALALGVILAFMWARGDVPSPPDVPSKTWLLPIGISLLNAAGYACFNALTSLAGVSLFTSMLGCSVVIPVAYGILARGESRPPRKLAGIACCVVAALMLGFSGAGEGGGGGGGGEAGGEPPADTPWALCFALFAGCIAFWSANDTLSAYLLTFVDAAGRPLSMFSVALLNALGFLVAAWMAAGGSYLLESLAPAGGAGGGGGEPPAPPPDPSAFASANALLFAGNLLGSAAWYGMVRLCAYGEASSFMPLISLDAFVPAALGIVFLGERMEPLGYGGMLVAAGGVALIATAG